VRPLRIRQPLARRFAAAVLLLSLAALPSASSAAPGATGRHGVPAFHHVFVVVMENLDYQSAMATPGLAHLAATWALATNSYGVSHPSLPNYLALTGGSTFSITSDCVNCYVNAPNLFSQLANSRHSFDAFLEGVPGSCYLSPWGGVDYASKHNPLRYFDNVRSSATLCSHLRPLTQLEPLLRGPSSAVPDFVWVTPDLCHDGHDCTPTTAATWLTTFVRSVTSSAAWRDHGVLLVTWDESDGGSSGVVNGRVVGSGGGGHVITLVIAPGLRRGLRVGVPYNHYSLLATVEDALGLPLLANARKATALSAFFRGT
jgi:hypothetical protein